jgi:RHS repeat-associated protein
LRSTVQPNGDQIQYVYDQAGRISRVEGPESKTERFYDSLGRVIEERIWRSDVDWTCTKTGYSPGGKTLWTSVEKSDGTEQRLMGYAYDEAGNRVVQKAGARLDEPGGETTYYRYNALNQLVSTEIQSAIGNLKSAMTYDYSGSSLVTTDADPLTNQTVTVADVLGRTRTVTKHNAAGELLHQTDFIYNAAGDLLEQVDTVCNSPDMVNHVTTLKWTYDEENNSGRKLSFTRAAESTVDRRTETYRYDEFGRLFCTAYPGGLQLFNYYDDAQRLKYRFSSDGTIRTRYDYDTAGRLKIVTDEINHVAVERTYGIENRLLDETVSVDGQQISTEYGYDRSGRPTRLRLENDTAIDYAYNGIDLRAVKRISGITAITSQGVTDYQHVYTSRDAMGRLMAATLIDGSTQGITRDDLGRRTAVTTPWWSWIVNSQNGYDLAGNLHAYTTVDPVGTLSYTNGYDNLYHLTNHQSSIANQQYSYDSIGNRLESLSTFLTGSTTSTYAYAYNELNELTSRTDPNGTLSGTITVPVRGLAKANPYTSQAITAVTVQLDSNPTVAAQLTGEEWELAGGGIAVPVDGSNHTLLITATDADGKVSSRTLTLNYNATASTSYVYDLRGNLVQKTLHTDPLQITSYTYDALNRLRFVVPPSGGSIEYKYDPLNRRICKTVTSDIPPSTSYYLWSGMNEIGAFDASLNLIQFRMLGEGLGAEVGAAVSVELRDGVSNPWKTYVPVHDFRGNVVCLVDKLSGSVAENYRYDAYGNTRIYDSGGTEIQDSAIHNPWRFSSKRFDSEAGCYYFTHRYYDSSVGRFLTTDPLGITDGINMYSYAGGNPMMFVDPSGLLAKGAAELGAAGIIGTWNTGVNVATSPFVFAEQTTFGKGDVVRGFKAAGISIWAGLQSYGRAYEVAQASDGFLELGLLVGYQVPILGNFLPSPRAAVNPEMATLIQSRGINGVSYDAAHDSDIVTLKKIGFQEGVNAESATYTLGSAIEVLSALFLGNTARGYEYAHQVYGLVGAGATINQLAHSGGVIRSLQGSKYLGYYDIGVNRNFSYQGPALGVFNNIQNLSMNYSPHILPWGEPTSTLGTVLSVGTFSLQNTDWSYIWNGDSHYQIGALQNGEWDDAARNYLNP